MPEGHPAPLYVNKSLPYGDDGKINKIFISLQGLLLRSICVTNFNFFENNIVIQSPDFQAVFSG